MYYEFEAGEKIYKLKLTTKSIVELERRIGGNPIMIFGPSFREIPSIHVMTQVLFYSMQKYHHEMKLEKVYDIFDRYLEKHDVSDFVEVIIGIYEKSGLIKSEEEQEEELGDEEEKNV